MAAAEELSQRQDLAGKGLRQLDEVTAAAFQILASLDHELCKPALRPSSSSHYQQQQHPPGPASMPADPDVSSIAYAVPGGSMDEARHRYRTTVAALRASVVAMSPSSQEIIPRDEKLKAKLNGVENKGLEEHAYVLKKEIESQNKDIKLIMYQLQNLLVDISTWQSPFSV